MLFKWAWWCYFGSVECNQFWKQLFFFIHVYQKWMIDFYVSSLHCPLPVPPHHDSLDDLSCCLSGDDILHLSVFLSHRLLKRERRQALFESSWQPPSVRSSMSHKPIQRDKLYETSAGRLVTFWYAIDFPMLYLCCWLLVATHWLWVAQCSGVSL